MDSGLIGGCALDGPDILMSHGDCFTLSLWTHLNGIYQCLAKHKFAYERDRVASMLRYNRFNRGQTEVFCVTEDSKLCKLTLFRP